MANQTKSPDIPRPPAPPEPPPRVTLIASPTPATVTTIVGDPHATLHIRLRDGSVQERELTKPETKIGKGSGNELILNDAAVSTSHAAIRYDGQKHSIADIGSRNGTFVNEMRLTDPRELHHGDVIRMGHCTLTLRLAQITESTAPRTEILGAAPPPPPTPPPLPTISAASPALTEDGLARAVIAAKLVAASEVERVRGKGARGRRLSRALIEERLITELGLRDLLSRTYNMSPVDLRTAEINLKAAQTLKPEFLREKLILPLVGPPDELTLAVADPTDAETFAQVKRLAGKPVHLKLSMPSELLAQIDGQFTPRLIGVLPTGEKLEVLINQAEIAVGKASHNKLTINEPTVSGTHATILARDGGFSIVDMGSSNGTFVNSTRLGHEAQTLQHGDQVQLGNVLLTFRNPSETVENKTAKLSLAALEEIRRRAGLAPAGFPTPAMATPPMGMDTPPVTPAAEDEEKAEKKRRKKEKEREKESKNNWFSANALSRIVAQVMGAVVTIGGTYLLITMGQRQTPSPSPGSGPVTPVRSNRLLVPGAWTPFSGTAKPIFEASSVEHVPNTDGVLVVNDAEEKEVFWLQLDATGKQVAPPKLIATGAMIKDPEAITTDGSFFYVVGSQGDPTTGAANAIARFVIDTSTFAVRGQAEVINDFRTFLLNHVRELKGVGEPPGLQGGLNIEGMAWDPIHSQLLLGLRSPIVGNQAMILPLKLKDPRGPFAADNLQPGSAILLSLGGFGIRDFKYDTHLKAFVIISGQPETVRGKDFRLWEWDPSQPNAQPVELTPLEGEVKPEGVTRVSIGGRDFLFLVGDLGSYAKVDYAN